MKCPNCNTSIPYGSMRIIEGNPDDDFVEIELICDECDKEYWGRFEQQYLIHVE